MNNKLGLYLHIPFCQKKCGYCDFNSYAGQQALMEPYINALIWQLEQYKISLEDYVVDTLYLGGGTPSLLPEGLLKKLTEAVKKNCNLSRMLEFTMEVNPASGIKKTLKRAKKCGVNRLSIGLQSAVDTELMALGRLHNKAQFDECFDCARELGFSNISIDLMFGLPAQTLESFMESLDYVVSKAPEHISVYSLKIEENTPFYETRDILRLPDEDVERDMYDLAINTLARYGYGQYEISNFCKRGYASQHNLKYWKCQEYLGLGVAAHSYFAGKRFSVISPPEEYIQNIKSGGQLIDEVLPVAPKERLLEYVMLGFRLNEGIDTHAFFSLFGREFEELFAPQLKKYMDSGHIKKAATQYYLTTDAMSISNYILSDFMEITTQT